MRNKLNDFMQNSQQLEMFGQINASDMPNHYRIVKYSKENSLYIHAYYENKKLEIFKETNQAINEFVQFIGEKNIIEIK